MYYNWIDLRKGADLSKSKGSKKCIVSHYYYFNHGFKFQKLVCSSCHDILMICLEIDNIAILSVKDIHYRCIIHDINKPCNLFVRKFFVQNHQDSGYVQNAF